MKDLTAQDRERLQHALNAIATRIGAPVTLDGLLNDWRTFVAEIERGYKLSLYDYTNDLTVRDRLDELTTALQPELRSKIEVILAPLDSRFWEATDEIVSPVMQRPQGWWRRIPRKRDPDFDADLDGA